MKPRTKSKSVAAVYDRRTPRRSQSAATVGRPSPKISVGPTRNNEGRVIVPDGNARTRPINYLGEAFDYARLSNYQGMFFLPGLDAVSARRPTQFSRHAYARKALLGYKHIPEMRAVIDGLAVDEVDTALWPKARTSNRFFNKAVTNRFHEENKDPRTFDLRQADSVYSAQFTIRRSIRLMGDMFGQLVRPFPDFLGRRTPSMSFIPGYQCTSDNSDPEDIDLRDGIRFDRDTNAPVKFRFAKPQLKTGKIEYTELEANDVLHFHDPFLPDEIRGTSTLAPFAGNMFSMNDIDEAETAGQIIRSGVAFAMETTGDDIAIPRLPGVTDTEVIENPDGTKTIIQKIRSRDGREVQVYTPPAGMKIKTLESNRGGALEYRNHIAKGMMYCTIYPPEWILFIAGLSQGTVARAVQNRVQKIANFFRANQLDEQFMARWYIFWLWKRMQAGVFDNVTGGIPDDWFLHKIIYPANMSVDLGRDGRLYAELVATGKMAWSDYHALFGRDDEDVDEELVDKIIARKILLAEKVKEAQHLLPGLTVTFEEIWRPPAGTANTPALLEAGIDPNTLASNSNGAGTPSSRRNGSANLHV